MKKVIEGWVSKEHLKIIMSWVCTDRRKRICHEQDEDCGECRRVRVTIEDTTKLYKPGEEPSYIRFCYGKVAKTRRVSPEVLADFDSSGKLIGIEILLTRKEKK